MMSHNPPTQLWLYDIRNHCNTCSIKYVQIVSFEACSETFVVLKLKTEKAQKL